MDNDNNLVYDFLVIGGGVAAFSAAMYAGRFNLKTLVIGEALGGTIILTDVVENYPGFISLTGLELANKIEEHARVYPNVTVENERVSEVQKIDEKPIYQVKTSTGKTFKSKTILFATGTEWKKLNVPGEKEFTNRGVHYCALCDGAFYKEKNIAVVGGSDSAAKEALVLTQWAKNVFIIYRGDKIHPEPVNQIKVEQNKKITIINHNNIVQILGEKKVNKVILEKPYNGSNEFAVDAIFVEIGHKPLSELAVKLGVNVDAKGEILIDRSARTNIKGIYAAGDVSDTEFKQAITGVAEGVHAAYSAYIDLGN